MKVIPIGPMVRIENLVAEIASRTYVSLGKIDILFEHDPEIAGRCMIRLLLTVSGAPEKVLEEESKFKKYLRERLSSQTCEKITVTYRWGWNGTNA